MKLIKLAIIFLILLPACGFEEDVKFEKIKNLKINSMKDGLVNLSAEADFYNPNNISGKLKSVNVEVLLKEKSLARITQNDKFPIEKNAAFSIPFKVDLKIADIQQGFLDNILAFISDKKVKLHFKGNIKVSTWGITQTVPVSFYEEVKL